LGTFLEEWPTTEGMVESLQQQSSFQCMVAYDFEVGGERAEEMPGKLGRLIDLHVLRT
jgi:hypothetical protein